MTNFEEASLKSVRAIRVAAAAVTATGVMFAAAGCGGGGDSIAEQTSAAIVGLYVIDHAGEDPRGDALDPYTEAFRRVQAGCELTPSELASSIVGVAGRASNGSGTTVTNLEALKAVARVVGTTPEDCSGVFVGVEARLQGGALDG